ncbi:LOW QUALITY PROTEIN: hypothetical protein CRUP_034912 [Coryphaenoides rupestris]|nr:LOW QUALITY PROTEIN: hypothetical protein CRUP_034912 [Coryphaenoides rupestris]
MEGSMLTISLGIWMELPGGCHNDRATPEEISSYYRNYVKLMGLQKNFIDNTYVTSVQKLCRGHKTEVCKMRDSGGGGTLWEVTGYQRVQKDTHVPFCLFAENVVLATGASDFPARLGIEGEELPFVLHSISDLGLAVSQGKLDANSDSSFDCAGLSAADAVLCACNANIPVLHIFRKNIDDPDLIFKQLPKMFIPRIS